MSSPAVWWRILQEVKRGLSQDLRYEAASGGDPMTIGADAIVIRKYPPPPDNERCRNLETMPGLIISPGRRVVRDPSRGTNEDDEPQYTLFCQLIAADADRLDQNLPTYLKWLEQAARYLNHHFARLHITGGDFGCVFDGFASVTLQGDPKEWVLHQNFVGGVEVTVIAWESRGVTE